MFVTLMVMMWLTLILLLGICADMVLERMDMYTLADVAAGNIWYIVPNYEMSSGDSIFA